MAFNIGELLSNPNFQQYLGHAGATLGGPGSVGAALDPSTFIRQQQMQKASQGMLSNMLAGQGQGIPTAPMAPMAPAAAVVPETTSGVPTTNTQPYVQPGTPSMGQMLQTALQLPLEAQKASDPAPQVPLAIQPTAQVPAAPSQVTPTTQASQTPAAANQEAKVDDGGGAELVNLLKGVDLRGLSPEDVGSLVSTAMTHYSNQQTLQANQANNQANQAISRATLANSQANSQATYALAIQKALAEQNKKTYSSPYEINGQNARDVLTGGSVTGREVIGDAKADWAPVTVTLANGTTQRIPYGTPIPAGAKLAAAPTQSSPELTAMQTVSKEKTMSQTGAFIDEAIEKGKDISTYQSYIDLYNNNDPNFWYKKEAVKNDWLPGTRDVYTKVPKYTMSNPLIPKTQAEIDQAPRGSIIIIDGKPQEKL